MAKNGLDKWFKQKWVDIGSKKKDGSFSKCGRSKQKADAKRKYPKCVPLAKARSMSEGQRRSAVKRKRAVAQGVGGKPTNVKTIVKRTKKASGGPGGTTTPYFGRSIKGSYGGVELSNPSYRKYYKGMI
jgi:hypothetical protein